VIDARDLGGGEHAEATLERWSKFANGEVPFRDASAALAIAALEAAPKPITGPAMRQAILRGTADLDARGASVEFEIFDAYVREHFGPADFTAEAAAVFLAYRNLAADAQREGRKGLPPGLLREALKHWSPDR
jgi:hypothetical protein